MDFAKGVATGFVIGVALIGTSVVTLYVHDDAAHERNAERIEQLDAHVRQLEVSLSRLAGRVASEAPAPEAPAPEAPKATPTALNTEQIR